MLRRWAALRDGMLASHSFPSRRGNRVHRTPGAASSPGMTAPGIQVQRAHGRESLEEVVADRRAPGARTEGTENHGGQGQGTTGVRVSAVRE